MSSKFLGKTAPAWQDQKAGYVTGDDEASLAQSAVSRCGTCLVRRKP